MFATTPSADYVSRRSTRREPNLSPSFAHKTPSRLPPHRKTMRSPSPFKRHTLPVVSTDDDDVFSSPVQVPFTRRENTPRRQSGLFAADDAGTFLAPPSSAHSQSLIPPSSSPMPLRTPVKQSRVTLPARPSYAAATGTKRKPNTPSFSTPDDSCILTPLNVTAGDSGDEGFGFNRLAPLSAPQWTARTPQTKADTERHLKKQADSMRKLKLLDRGQSSDESGYDSGAEAKEVNGIKPLTTSSVKAKSSKLPSLAIRTAKHDEVVESMSPGGHVNKRRARSRPVSTELLRSVANTPVSKKNDYAPTPVFSAKKASSSVAFPSHTGIRGRRTSSSSSSSAEVGSPRRRTRPNLGPATRPRPQSQNTRAPNRLTSHSSATLFFGPSIPQTEARPKRIETSVGRPQYRLRHSYTGGGLWRSPKKSDDMDEEDLFFSSPPANAPFNIDLSSPTKKRRSDIVEMLPKKFRPRDSGVLLDDSDDELFRSAPQPQRGGNLFATSNGNSSSSFSSLQSESDIEALVTPSLVPGPSSGWPGVSIVSSNDDLCIASHLSDADDEADAFILRTLTSGNKPSADVPGEPKRVPGTPVKKVKTSHLLERPWQSAVAHKIGLPEFDPPRAMMTGKENKGKPRPSLPAAFPGLYSARPRRTAGGLSVDLDNEDEEGSPTTRKEVGYDALGLGKPPVPLFSQTCIPRSKRWLVRRTSSGAFSSGSETAMSRNVTPTRLLAKEWGVAARHSPLAVTVPLHDSTRSNSTSATNSPVIDSPTLEIAARHNQTPRLNASTSPKKASASTVKKARPGAFPGSAIRGRMSFPSAEERPGRFELEFIEIDELGRGEFGRVMKAQYKEGESEMFAVKKSKRFEGVKHRLRLREEVDILKHLSHAAARAGLGLRHPNVLGYVDSWEEDETLFIQTELCSLGNFSHLLWEYGRAFPRLDEARVWKIFAELSDGLRFIHHAGVIHLDLKPANIFITGEGRFKIGDFGMASIWPRPPASDAASTSGPTSFEREGDKLYLAPEVLQGKYSKAVDIFSFGMTILETATNIIIPDQGDAWHRIRHENFAQVDLAGLSTELVALVKSMLRTDPTLRVDVEHIYTHPVIMRARVSMELARETLGANFQSSALASAPLGWLESILGYDDEWNGHEDDEAMDLCP